MYVGIINIYCNGHMIHSSGHLRWYQGIDSRRNIWLWYVLSEIKTCNHFQFYFTHLVYNHSKTVHSFCGLFPSFLFYFTVIAIINW